MKTIVRAGLLILVVAPRPASAQVQVYKDQQGVETYTNVPRSRRAAPAPGKDAHGVQVYTNVSPSFVGNHRTHDQPTATDAVPTGASSSPAPALMQEPPLPSAYAAPGKPYESTTGPAPASDGQWVYTQQYGWVWMPYGAKYVSEGSTGDESPYAYVYEPSDGWTWLAAPWVWGWGPYPYFGSRGPGRFGWYTGLMHAGYAWGSYRGGGVRAGFASRGDSIGRRAGPSRGVGTFGRGFAGGRFGAGFRANIGSHGAPAGRNRGFGGRGFSGDHGGGHGGGGRGGGGGRR